MLQANASKEHFQTSGYFHLSRTSTDGKYSYTDCSTINGDSPLVMHLNSIEFNKSVSAEVHLLQAAEAFTAEGRDHRHPSFRSKDVDYLFIHSSIHSLQNETEIDDDEMNYLGAKFRKLVERKTCQHSREQERQLKQRRVQLVSSNWHPAVVLHCSRRHTVIRVPGAKCAFLGRATPNGTNISLPFTRNWLIGSVECSTFDLLLLQRLFTPVRPLTL